MRPPVGGPGSMALPNPGRAAELLLRRARLPGMRAPHAIAMASVAAAAGTGAYLQQNGSKLLRPKPRSKVQLPRPLMEVICGAVGEIVQAACLFPLDTVKVRCQASGLTARQVTAELFRNGLNRRVVAQLYAGVFSTSVCSVAIGSLYYLTFCAARRAASAGSAVANKRQAEQQQQRKQEQQQKQKQQPQEQQEQQHARRRQRQEQPQQEHGELGGAEYRPHVMLASISSHSISAGSNCTSGGSHSGSHSGGGSGGGSSGDAGSSAAAGQQRTQTKSGDAGAAEGATGSGDSLGANMFASCAAALVGALVEAPVELFKHQAQVGMLQGNMLGHMASSLRTGGIGALYPSFLPFCFKSLPFDIGELLTYSQLQDARGSPAVKKSVLGGLPPHAWDMGIGAAAGAVAVLVSMPCDTIKTVMETSPGLPTTQGPLASTRQFAATAKQLVARSGPGALYVGMGPRLLEQVPSTMLYWLAVEGCRRMLEPYTAPA